MKANLIKQEILDANPEAMAKAIQEYKFFQRGDSTGFTSCLIEAMSRADRINIGKLSLAFPYLAEVVYSYQNIDGWHKENGFED